MNQESKDHKQDENFQEFHDFHLASYSDFTDADAEENFSSMKLDSFGESDLNGLYRSVSVMQSSNTGEHFFRDELVAPSRGGLANQNVAFHRGLEVRKSPAKLEIIPQIPVSNVDANTTSINSSSQQKTSHSGPISVPAEPFYIAPATHFTTKFNVGDIKARVEVVLNAQSGVSYEFFGAKCHWEGVYLVGSSRCKFEVNVYKRISGGFVVEGNRLSGDSYSFVNIYKAVRHGFDPSQDKTSASSLQLPPTSRPVDLSKVEKSISAVIAMAACGKGEGQLGASQILCELSSDTLMHETMQRAGCVEILVDLMDVDFESCNQHALCGLANLSSTKSCKDALIRNEKFLQNLLPLCSDGTYNTIEMRRECARLLSNLCCSGGDLSCTNAEKVATCAGLENVSTWVRSVDGLRDARLREHAVRAKLSLSSFA